MEKYESLKQASYTWLGNIPSHWQELFLEQVAREKCEKNSSNSVNQVLSLSYGNIKIKKDLNKGLIAKDLSTYQIVKPGDIIMRLTDLQNDHKSLRTGLVNDIGIITSAYLCLFPKIDSKYLQYLLHLYDTQKVFYGMGGGVRQSIGFKDIRHMYLPVPPCAEQDQIVRFLDWKVSEINKLIGIRKKEISELESLKLCHITNVITKGLNNDIKKKSTSSKWIRDIPTHWDLVAVRRVYKVILGKMLAPNRTTNSDKLEEYICAKDVHFDGITLSDLKKMWFSKFERKQYQVFDGDLLVVEGGAGAGNAALLYKKDKKDVYVQNSVHIIRAKDDKAINSYLCFWLFSLVKRGYMESVCSVATIPHYTKDKVLSTVMPLPPLEEQQKIVEHLEKYSAGIDALILKNKNTINEMLELKNTIISDVVTGKIDVRNVVIPEYEHIDDAADAGDGEENAEKLAEAEEMEA